MNGTPISTTDVIGATIATLIGVAFFFAIIGVFGLTVSMAALMLFILLAILIFRRPQSGEARP